MSTRSAQVVAAGLAVLLILLVGAVIFLLLSRPQPAVVTRSPAVSPTAVAGFTPSPLLTASPGFIPFVSPLMSPGPSASPSPTLPPTPSPSPTAQPTPTPSPTPAPTVHPTSTQRELRILRLGLDSREAEGAIERYLIFHTDGQSLISARLSDVTGRVRMCLWQGNLVEERECRTLRNGRLELPNFGDGQQAWTLTMIGAEADVSPTVDLTLRFNADAPAVTMDSFRFQGTAIENYNGVVAGVDTVNGGDLRIDGSFDDGQGGSYPHLLLIERLNDGEVLLDQSGEPATSFQASESVAEGRSFRVTLSNENEVEELAVFLRATLSWP